MRAAKSLAGGLAALAAIALVAAPAQAQTTDLVNRSSLRVCADPANMPLSNEKRQGFENKIAALIGKTFDIPVTYTWFPQATGFVRKTLNEKKCDLIIGFAQGHELVQNTNHYYRSAYVLVHRASGPLAGVRSLSDPRLRAARIGVIAGTPPATIMAVNGLMARAKPFPLMVDRRHFNPAGDMVREIADGKLDAGVLWGPIGGYYAKQSSVPLTVVPLVREGNGPRMSYRITMGVRRGEREWKRKLNRLIRRNQAEIDRILLGFGVPLLSEDGKLLTSARQ